MTHGSLFSGIGGFDLAAEWMGWKNVFHCEWNPFGQKILKYYWPKAISYEDITKTDFSIHRGKIDILTGGFPCQPYSLAGLRKGKEDERHLWPEMLRAVREIKPRWVVGENVLGLVGWNDGMVFEEVQADLEAEGYEVQPYVLPAASVGAPHRRDRVWFVAYTRSYGSNGRTSSSDWQKENEAFRPNLQFEITGSSPLGITPDTNNNGPHGTEDRQSVESGNDGSEARKIETIKSQGCPDESSRTFADPTGERLEESGQTGISELSTENRKGLDNRPEFFGPLITNDNQLNGDISGFCTSRVSQQQKTSIFDNSTSGNDEHSDMQRREEPVFTSISNGQNGFRGIRFIEDWSQWPAQPPVCDGDDGFSSELDGITFSKWRTESIKAGGNAIVPQVVHQIFKAINEFEKEIIS